MFLRPESSTVKKVWGCMTECEHPARFREAKKEAHVTRNTLILLINIYSFLLYECLPACVSAHQVCTVELELDSWEHTAES